MRTLVLSLLLAALPAAGAVPVDPPAPLHHGLRFGYSLSRLNAEFTQPAHVPGHTPIQFSISHAWRSDGIDVQVPPVATGEWSSGLGVVLDMPPVEPGRHVAVLKLTTRGTERSNGKDAIVVKFGGRLHADYHLPDGEYEHRFQLGDVAGGRTVELQLFMQSQPNQGRAAPLRMQVTSIALEVFDVAARTAEYLERLEREPELLGGARSMLNGAIERIRKLNREGTVPDDTFFYEYERVFALEDRLSGVDRKVALKAIVDRIVPPSAPAEEKHRRVVAFVQRHGHHGPVQPVYPDQNAVLDPLMLIELHEYRCGAAARLGLDLLDQTGVPGRLVQCVNHISAETFYGGGWHVFEADLLSNGQVPRLFGKIPSFVELSAHPEQVDRLPSYMEPGGLGTGRHKALWHVSSVYFNREGFGTRPFGYVPHRFQPGDEWDRFYGWRDGTIVPEPAVLYQTGPPRWFPRAPRITAVQVHGRRVRVTWEPCDDPDGDLGGYRVFVSRRSRGWNYPIFFGPEAVRAWSSTAEGWRPHMYEHLSTLPPGEVADLRTEKTSVDLDLPARGAIHVSVMPWDRYGALAGRILYPPSIELMIGAER